MSCPTDTTLLDEYLDGSLNEAARRRIEAHLENCPRCSRDLGREFALRSALRNQPVEAPSPGFATRVLRHATRQKPRGRKSAFAAGFATAALAATLVMWIAAGPLLQAPAPSVPQVALTIDEPRDVRLVFSSAQEIETATIVMALPAHVEIDGRPGVRELRWQASLASGKNLIVLPLIARSSGEGDIITQLIHGSETKEFRLRVGAGTAPSKDRNVNF